MSRCSFLLIPMVWQTRAAQEGVVTLRQIAAVKFPEGGLGTFWGNAVEISPAHSSNAAIVVTLAFKPGFTERQRWEIGNWSRRQQRCRDTLVARVAAGDPRNSCPQNVSPLGQRNAAQN